MTRPGRLVTSCATQMLAAIVPTPYAPLIAPYIRASPARESRTSSGVITPDWPAKATFTSMK